MGPRSPESPAYPSSANMGRESPAGDGNNSVCENASSVATPSSVHLIGSPLVRELSDLSGSYVNGSPLAAASGGIPRNIFGRESSPQLQKQPWRQSYSLSTMAPEMDDGPKMPILFCGGESHTTPDMIMVERNGGVEVLPSEMGEPSSRSEEKLPLDASHAERCPVIIVLMHPGHKSYELMQLWLDLERDTVREVLQTLRQSLPNTWNQDYDGLAQFRRDRFSQLINCLRIQQFAVEPYEIWVAKPWALSADRTAKYAEDLLEHLKMIGILSSNALSPATTLPPKVGEAPPTADGVLTLSEDARKRIHAPDGILTHHHAIQFLSFGPPFEKPLANKPPIFPSSVAVKKRVSTSPPTLPPRAPPPSPPTPPSPPIVASHEVALESTNFYTEFDISSGVPTELESPPRAASPGLLRAMSPDSLTSSAKSPEFSTDASTQESQDWDDGTIKMSSNLRERRFSLQNIASQCELTLNRTRSSASKSKRRLATLRACFGGLNCTRRVPNNDLVVDDSLPSEGTAQGSAFSSFGHDDVSLGQHLLTLYEVDEEEDSMASMPLLSTSRGFVYDEYVA